MSAVMKPRKIKQDDICFIKNTPNKQAHKKGESTALSAGCSTRRAAAGQGWLVPELQLWLTGQRTVFPGLGASSSLCHCKVDHTCRSSAAAGGLHLVSSPGTMKSNCLYKRLFTFLLLHAKARYLQDFFRYFLSK